MCFQFTASPGTKVLLNQMKLRRKLFTRGKEILEQQLSKPRFFTGFKSRALFLPTSLQGRKGRDFRTPLNIVALRFVLISFSL